MALKVILWPLLLYAAVLIMPQHTFQIDNNTIAFYSLQDNDHNLHLTEHLLKKARDWKTSRSMIDIAIDWSGQVICHSYQMCTHEFVNATQVQIT